MGWIAILLSLVQLGMQVFPECGLQVDKAEPLACLLAVAFLLSHPPGQELVLGRTTCLEKGHLACWLQSCRPTALLRAPIGLKATVSKQLVKAPL